MLNGLWIKSLVRARFYAPVRMPWGLPSLWYNLLSSRLQSESIKIKTYAIVVLAVVLLSPQGRTPKGGKR